MARLKISVLDVGHGDFIFAQSPHGHSLVIDCGSGTVIPSVFLRNVSTLDELQVSHPHTDHFYDLPALESKTIRSFRCPPPTLFDDGEMGWRSSDKPMIASLKRLASTHIPDNAAVSVGNGFDHTVWRAPQSAVDYDDPNTVSLVTTLSYGGFKMLFGGDLPTVGWEALLKDQNFVRAITGTTFFKVPHHGRAVGTCDALFEVINPRTCVISDKPIDGTNENTVCTDWYRQRSLGCKLNNGETRHVLTTRRDGSIHFQADELGQWCFQLGCDWNNQDVAL
jgi:beta-lactamase superfamily II metal-dependent hydrolase